MNGREHFQRNPRNRPLRLRLLIDAFSTPTSPLFGRNVAKRGEKSRRFVLSICGVTLSRTETRPLRSPLAVHRYSAGLSRHGLAQLAGGGIVRETVSRAETGRVKPRPRTQRALAAALSLPVGVLFPENDNGAPPQDAAVKTPAGAGRHDSE